MREYLIKKHGAGISAHWKVKIGREVHGDYLSEWAALLDAVDAAYEDGEAGTGAEVLIEREDGTAEVVWRVGDAYPLQRMPACNDNPERFDAGSAAVQKLSLASLAPK
jgi:hypothetical protein